MPYCTTPTMNWGSSYFTSLPEFGVVHLFNFNNSPGHILVAQWGFNFHFLMTNDVENTFKGLLDTYVPLWSLCSSVLPIFIRLTLYYSLGVFYIFHIHVLCQIHTEKANIFSQSIACLCIFKFTDLFCNIWSVNPFQNFFS